MTIGNYDEIQNAIDRTIRDLDLRSERSRERLKIATDVLAWYLAVRHSQHAAILWPESCVLLFEPLLTWLAFRDPVIFIAAKQEAAGTIAKVGIDPDDRALIDLFSRLLTTECPARRRKGGDKVARDLLIISAAHIAVDCGGWGEDVGRPDGGYSTSGIARHLCDSLNAHPYLSTFPDAIPTEDAIRAVWKSRYQKLRTFDLPAELLDDVYMFSATV